MHLNKILEQIKRHQSPTEAIDKLATALEKHEGSLLEKGFTILKSELAANMYEAINGPHFDEEHAHYAVEGMENEDGTKGPHWTVEETTSVANQMGINLKSEKHNKWDWFVAMNMIYSDFYKAVVAMREMQNKIDTLRDEKNALQSSALLQQQTSNIVSQIRPCPVPAYLTCNPYGCNGGLNGYGYGYPYGYGDSCCA